LLQLVDPKLGANIRAAWEEYENGNTPEATPEGRWVREMDKFECMIQAHEYEQSTYGERNLEEFQGQTKYIHSQEGKDMLELLQQERQAHFQKRSQRTPVIFVKGISCSSWLAWY
jgi:putative hydrolase of HD superfamily